MNKPLTIFVAMPYTDLGPTAKWKRPGDVIRFYQKAIEMIGQRRGCSVKFDFEKWRAESGSVHETMFNAIFSADVLIADLTGANANVFFELGVRFSLRRSVTVLTSQDEKVPFDLLGMRLVRYANGPDEDALNQIVDFVSTGLDSPDHVDSPIISKLDLHVLARDHWERVAGVRIKSLLDKARDPATGARQRLELVTQAVKDDPFSHEARLAQVQMFRQRQDYSSGQEAVDEALEFFGKSWQLLRERGLMFDKMEGDEFLPRAIDAYRQALDLQPDNPDLHCCLGGSLRRLALRGHPDKRAPILENALDHYSRAVSLERYSTYAGLNTLRLLLLMGRDAGDSSVQAHIQRMFHLCAFEVADSDLQQIDQRWWKLFDYGDTHVFSSNPQDAVKTYQDAINMIPKHIRPETLVSPLRTWRELVKADVLGKRIRDGAEEVISVLAGAASTTPAG